MASLRVQWVIEATYEHQEGQFVSGDELAEEGGEQVEAPESILVDESTYELADAVVEAYPAGNVMVDSAQLRQKCLALADQARHLAKKPGSTYNELMNLSGELRGMAARWTL